MFVADDKGTSVAGEVHILCTSEATVNLNYENHKFVRDTKSSIAVKFKLAPVSA
jgi:hypothetical protein